jgi:hypothetical protein
VLDSPLAVESTNIQMTFFRSNRSRRVAITILSSVLASLLFACGDPKYQPPAIVVSFSPTPPTSINTDSTVGITAVVANDNNNAGVNFSCAPVGACGLFNPAQIASNVPTCYQAPAQVPTGNTVTLTATSVTDSTKSITSAPITVLNGSPVQPCTP